jgi:hypothetical protein
LIDIEKQLPIEYLMNNIVVSDQIYNCWLLIFNTCDEFDAAKLKCKHIIVNLNR